MSVLINVYDGKELKQYPLNGVLNIGRSSKNDIVLKHAKISKFHAQIIMDLAGKIYIKDMFSLNGTVLNTGHITMEQLMLGDIIYIWEYQISIDAKSLPISEKKRIGKRESGKNLEITLKYEKTGRKTSVNKKKTKVTKMTSAKDKVKN